MSKLNYPWDMFPEDYSSWECCIRQYKQLIKIKKAAESLIYSEKKVQEEGEKRRYSVQTYLLDVAISEFERG